MVDDSPRAKYEQPTRISPAEAVIRQLDTNDFIVIMDMGCSVVSFQFNANAVDSPALHQVPKIPRLHLNRQGVLFWAGNSDTGFTTEDTEILKFVFLRYSVSSGVLKGLSKRDFGRNRIYGIAMGASILSGKRKIYCLRINP